MSKGFRPRATCLSIALVALAIQAITPDARDLTSFSISRILQSILSNSIATADDAAPWEDDTPDETADDVCSPASAGTRIAKRRPTSCPRLSSTATPHGDLPIRPTHRHPSCPFGGAGAKRRVDPHPLPPYLLIPIRSRRPGGIIVRGNPARLPCALQDVGAHDRRNGGKRALQRRIRTAVDRTGTEGSDSHRSIAGSPSAPVRSRAIDRSGATRLPDADDGRVALHSDTVH